MEKWNIVATHPQDQLLSLYGLDPQIGLYKLTKIAFRQRFSSGFISGFELWHAFGT